MLCIQRYRVMPAGRIRCWQEVQYQETKTEQQKVQLYYEDDPLCPSSYISYLWLQPSKGYRFCVLLSRVSSLEAKKQSRAQETSIQLHPCQKAR